MSPEQRSTTSFNKSSRVGSSDGLDGLLESPPGLSLKQVAPEPNLQELHKHAAGVVKSRSGAVLARGFILKSDHRPTSSSSYASTSEKPPLIRLRGAPNFRSSGLGVYGCAQPTITGLKTVLSALQSQPQPRLSPRETIWFCTREEPLVYIGNSPFVLRDGAQPTKTYSISDRPESLEGIESRLKADILKESARYGGVILVQEELSDGDIVSTWVAAESVKTVREVYESIAEQGFNVKYHRIPVTRDQSPEDRYLDSYTAMIAKTDPSSSLVFNCGIGVVRTTFAMATATIIRRKQLVQAGEKDPLAKDLPKRLEGLDNKTLDVIKSQEEQTQRDQSLLRLMSTVQRALAPAATQSILPLMLTMPRLLDHLRTAINGDFDIILSLIGLLDKGKEMKTLVDRVIDHVDDKVNLRESILELRTRHAAMSFAEDKMRSEYRTSALAALERYIYLVIFASYVSDADSSFSKTFTSWLHERNELDKLTSTLRKHSRFQLFSPVHDLSALVRPASSASATANKIAEVQSSGDEVVSNEWSRQIVKSRSGIILRAGTILKADQWQSDQDDSSRSVRGAQRFRRVPGYSLYGLSQPTEEGVSTVLSSVQSDLEGGAERIAWINLREEPLLYINGTPYVLRSEAVSLRNTKSYSGISSTRLELIEDRLKSDVLAEVKAFDGRILLHTETRDGTVVPVYEAVESTSAVRTLREVMDEARQNVKFNFRFARVPITAEKSPDFHDVREIVEIVTQQPLQGSAIIVNDQLGRGRSTRAQILIALIQRWLRLGGQRFPAVTPTNRHLRYSYTVINNLLRTVRSGQEVKNAVDEAITACSGAFDLLESIEEARQAAIDAGVETEKGKERLSRGLEDLRSYFFLILFASFLNESRAETWRELGESSSYETFVKDRPVFKTIERELDGAGVDALQPLEKPLKGDAATVDEVADFVAKRSGRILTPFTLLKSDFFSGLQKMSLPERVEGAPNFRRVNLFFDDHLPETLNASTADELPLVYGTGMPTADGLRKALERMGSKHRTVVWTSMREEPVLYVQGRPHVLRLFNKPLENVVTTGVKAQTVEAMESALKEDVLGEVRAMNGRVLLHDEVMENGNFTVTASWEDVDEKDIMTPKEVFQLMVQESLQVDYERLPVTDEQAPIPAVMSRIEERVSHALAHQQASQFAFNCQMGRGRTTTGMVAAALVSNILYSNHSSQDLSASFVTTFDDVEANPNWDSREQDPYLQGDYKLILQLVGVLAHGKEGKKIVDYAIDNMEGVQNLRKAIFDYKLRADSAAAGSKKAQSIHHIALNYLYRYGTLIAFASYLLEKAEQRLDTDNESSSRSDNEKAVARARVTEREPSFAEWLAARREIGQILSKKTLE